MAVKTSMKYKTGKFGDLTLHIRSFIKAKEKKSNN